MNPYRIEWPIPDLRDTRPDKTCSALLALESVREAAGYLRDCGVKLPRFRITAEPALLPFGGSFVTNFSGTMRLNMGRYPTSFLRRWFAMHELGHVLWHHHRPLRWERFREEFGEDKPDDYNGLATKLGWKTAGTLQASWIPGPRRPKGQPSWYESRGGGQERFCELLGLMWAHGDFTNAPPRDLAGLWDTCWEQRAIANDLSHALHPQNNPADPPAHHHLRRRLRGQLADDQ